MPEGYVARACRRRGASRSAWPATCRQCEGRRRQLAPPTRRCRWACTTTACTTSRSTAADARPAGDEPRVHRRRPAARRRHEDLDRPRRSRKSQTAHGVSVIEVAAATTAAGRWCGRRAMRAASPRHAVRDRRPGRRPRADEDRRPIPAGRSCSGTFNNCASGKTPWGTYLSGEENFAFYFRRRRQRSTRTSAAGACARSRSTAGPSTTSASTRRSIRTSPTASAGWSRSTRWTRLARRSSAPRSAAPRTKAPGSAITKDGRAVVYSGEDARFEYIYKFVSRDRDRARRRQGQPRAARPRHAVRRAASTPTAAAAGCRWCTGQGPLTAANGFADQGEVRDQGAPGQRRARRARRWTGPSGSRSTRKPARSTAR